MRNAEPPEAFDGSGRLLEGDAAGFRRCFGAVAFALRHRLVETGLFSIPRLERCAEEWLKLGRSDRFTVSRGQERIGAKFDDMPGKPRLASEIEALERSKSWIKISDIGAVDPDYQALMDAVLRDTERLSGRPILRHVTWTQMSVFMASPGVATPYHIDHEQNFLCQIAGEKDVCLYDPSDRDVLPETEIERFYVGNPDGANFREALVGRGRVFRMVPGVAVHFPSLAPHWVKNGDAVSLSVSLNFCMRDIDRRARIYQLNHYLRRLKIAPAPPGRSPVADLAKASLLSVFSAHHPMSYRDAVFSGLERMRKVVATLAMFWPW